MDWSSQNSSVSMAMRRHATMVENSRQVAFPVGFHRFHPDVSMNFQLNRFFGWVGEQGMLEEMREAAPRIRNYADWKRELLLLAGRASRDGHMLRAAYYYRCAEFFMMPEEPDRKVAREKFLETVRAVHGLDSVERHAIPYVQGSATRVLPAYRFAPARSKGTIVFFGGFDSYIEELAPFLFGLRDAGYETIAFEGPGQGAALYESGIPMTPDWHKPVGAVLDHFGVDNVALCGLSLGGCLVIRAAAIEKRVARAIAYDVLSDFFEANLAQVGPVRRRILETLLSLRAAPIVNALARLTAAGSPIAEWGIREGMYVTGARTPYCYLQKIRQFRTDELSPLVEQDVLLMAGAEDHYVPLVQLYRQVATLTNARSVTARVFTRAESAQNHCQAGNYGLALRTIVDWLDGSQPSRDLAGDVAGYLTKIK